MQIGIMLTIWVKKKMTRYGYQTFPSDMKLKSNNCDMYNAILWIPALPVFNFYHAGQSCSMGRLW